MIRKTRVRVWSGEADEFPESVLGLIEWLILKMATHVPEKHRENVTIEFGYESDFEVPVTIEYFRDMTDEEALEAADEEASYQKMLRDSELRQLKILQEKYAEVDNV